MPVRRDNARAPNFEAMRLELVRLRAERGLTFDALADRSGLSRTGLINLAHGTTHGSLETWFRVAQALEVPLADLVAKLDEPATRPTRSRRS